MKLDVIVESKKAMRIWRVLLSLVLPILTFVWTCVPYGITEAAWNSVWLFMGCYLMSFLILKPKIQPTHDEEKTTT